MLKKNFFAAAICIAFVLIALYDIGAFIDNARRGLLLFGQNVLPILFPFFFISSFLIELDFFKLIAAPFAPVTKKLFRTSGKSAPVLFLSFLSGYPTGARMLSELYTRGEITRNDAIKTSAFTSTASPVFIIATTGTILLGSTALGVVIFAAHILGALFNGVLYRNVQFGTINELPRQTFIKLSTNNIAKQPDIGESISRALNSSVQNIFAVGGLIIIFFIAAAPFGTLTAALFEMTNGVFRASEIETSAMLRAIIPCAIVTFGGLCVAVQGFVFLKNFKMPVWFYFLFKITHMFLSIIICVVLCIIFKL